ncbi:MAG: hypothetical protein ABJG88_02420 [Litorimonas sp.]
MTRLILIGLLLLAAIPHHAFAQIDVEFDEEKPHHLSIFTGGSYIDEADKTVFTLGVDYEYRLTPLIGLGFVAEQAFGEIDATTLIAVADIHLWKGLAIQVGPGIEFVDNETFAVGRIGALYEVEFEHEFTISPQLHYDISGGENAIVFGLAVGKAF